jgi:Tol biopolymer transport system component
MRKLITLMLLAAGITAVMALPAAAKPGGTNGKIVLNSDNLVTGHEQVYTVDPDRSDLQLLANDAEAGQWSPNGTSILLNGGILNFDTGSFTDLSLGTLYPDLFLGCGVWSPDATRLACEGDVDADPSLNGVYTVRSSDGGDLQQVTSNPFDFGCPSDYSPNGKRLIVAHGTLAVVKLDGSGLRQITPPGMFFNQCDGTWSPQGNEILFSAHVPARTGARSGSSTRTAAGCGRSQSPDAAAQYSAASTRAGHRTGRRSSSPASMRTRVSRTSTPSTRTAPASSRSRTRRGSAKGARTGAPTQSPRST